MHVTVVISCAAAVQGSFPSPWPLVFFQRGLILYIAELTKLMDLFCPYFSAFSFVFFGEEERGKTKL